MNNNYRNGLKKDHTDKNIKTNAMLFPQKKGCNKQKSLDLSFKKEENSK